MSPELKKALEDQCGLNPEDIFGKMAPLRIEGKKKKFNWFFCVSYYDINLTPI